MALAEYEKRNGRKVVPCGQIIYFWVSWTLYLVTVLSFCRVLKTGKERGQEGVHVCPLPQKKVNGFARFTKMGLSRSGKGTSPPIPPLGATTAKKEDI